MQTYRIIGLMSGTSLDGLDIAYCTFTHHQNTWQYSITHAECIPYPDAWKQRLGGLIHTDIVTYLKTDAEYGFYIAQLVNGFMHRHGLMGKTDCIAWHGQTIIHQPQNRFTAQIGNGAELAVHTGVPVVCNLRANDVAAGGQGAPVVPITDKWLFPQYLFCLNIGGIANISCKLAGGGIIGYDICPANLLLNYLASLQGLPYDPNGNLAQSGSLHPPLLQQLNTLPFYGQPYPKSLDAGFVPNHILPLLQHAGTLPTTHLLHTATEHIATQIAAQVTLLLQQAQPDISLAPQMLITGGGAFNDYLVSRIAALSHIPCIVPHQLTVNYKEALAMAFMAALRLQGQPNCLSTVTGAAKDTIGGCIYLG
ncbi:MAG TPA: anhydro-N-acetylmuramic acid kinase [Chitinophagales bacterium]|mgnify:CR=1 FL=1|nr:anhydro-N-acetylmuramic acid kinase [Chitinophagales bacterium]HRK27978.1 anhydro-N-acetylmuramic acid kinase [Chitinophagales bacterium]